MTKLNANPELRSLSVVAAMAALVLCLAINAFPQIGDAPTKSPAPPFVCSNATLNSGFATRGSGVVPQNPFDPTSPLIPFANVSLMTFDGNGGLTNAVTNSVDGTIISGTNSGTYELEEDCSGTLTVMALPGPLTFKIVVGSRGKEFFMISTNRSVVTVEGKRVE